ncbi:hypothetical protein I3843_07G171700 [Carya illinoinensis]|uniref:A-kinase anchor protein 17A n=1 Tax=Carya illinoinensis TaxID=32201 RepID=A0A8T1Q433_CARIL|nr:A-kinase anchor protein 17A isoform X1 [Carya illinoinensis]KAG2698967.1 hypothetical protein I3760_07G172100 [Carya illinoinensis]KAG6648873.1 hypothetical protein CIPAW_07G174600 [Carya illinoinensis]KAG6705388.1 hypothetical protein I3842_07G177300 [Carya illinoinensis]KAG7972195.1 hypothetical protein I3843_07G171700 [Carya illinoinensis]
MSNRPFDSLPPTESLELENGLTLVPRVKLSFTIYPTNPTVTKPVDEWKLKLTLIDFLQTSLSSPVTVPEDDLEIRRVGDLKKRKREDPVAQGSICIRDLRFLNRTTNRSNVDEEGKEEEDVKVLEKKYMDWRKYIVEKMDGMELNLEGVKYRLNVAVPASDDFEAMKKAWEEFYAFGNRGHSRSGRQEPDTIVLRGLPSRWFAEPLVSSKPSMLVTHSIFSRLGTIRNLNVAEDNDLGKEAEEIVNIVSGLSCKIVVQFEKFKDFYNALKVLSGRSLQKQGSRLKADYEVNWDKDRMFQNSRSHTQETSRMSKMAAGNYRSEAPRRQQQISRSSPDDARRKRFKD